VPSAGSDVGGGAEPLAAMTRIITGWALAVKGGFRGSFILGDRRWVGRRLGGCGVSSEVGAVETGRADDEATAREEVPAEVREVEGGKAEATGRVGTTGVG
jgi:hypothetical protein